jgi:hypothetical protein
VLATTGTELIDRGRRFDLPGALSATLGADARQPPTLPLKKLTAAEEKKIAALVKKAVR